MTGAMPAFAPQGGLALVCARGLAVMFLLSLSGTLVFASVVAPRALAHAGRDSRDAMLGGLNRWLRLSAACAAAGLLAWLVLITASLAHPEGLAEWREDLRAVLGGTSFGRVLLVQMALVAGAMLLAGRRPGPARRWAATALGSAACVAELGHGHAYAMAPRGLSVLEISEALHLWAAGAWLGGLVPLLLVTLRAPPREAALAARWFSPLGKACVVLMAVSSCIQGVVLVGSIRALLGTAYGWTALLKLGLFGVLLGFALLNRHRLAPALLGPAPATGRRRLLLSLAVQTGFGVLVVAAAALLCQLRPGMDLGMHG